MKNKELFTLSPDENNLINDGVVEINTAHDDKGLITIRHELKTFVCEGEYQKGIFRILDTYLKNFSKPKQPAVWVSGFFGSGKSHLVKMLGIMWENFTFPDSQTARTIKTLPADVNDQFVELAALQKINGKLTISGTLKDFPAADIRYAFLQLFLNSLGLPQQFHHFKFVYWAKQEGIFDDLKILVESQGKDFRKEYENLFVSSAIAKAVLELKPEFAENEAKVKENFKANFKRVENISRDQLIDTIKNEALPLFYGDKIPCTVIILDEIQQFIGQDGDKSIDVQNLAQDICSNFDGKFLLIGTGQNSLSETNQLQRLQDRFTVKVMLSDADVETVTRKTVLEKKPTVIRDLDKKLDAALGEISRNLSGTDFAYVVDDRKMLVADYPIIPSTRKFWIKILKAIDKAGTAGQLRSQLRIVNDSLKNIADKPVGNIVPADFIFEQKQAQLLQNALLLNETNNQIQERKSKTGDSVLEGRILSVVFLIDQLPKDVAGVTLKSDANTIADLLLDNILEGSDKFRNKVKELIKKLTLDDKVLMPVGDEVKLQTKEGAEWEQEYIGQAIKINSSGDDKIQQLRKEKITAFFKDRTKTINILQGVSKLKRDFDVWDKTDRPNTDNKLNLWVRDGWNENEGSVLSEIRGEGTDAPLAYVFVKKFRDQDLRAEIIKFLAADLALQTKGLPSSPEGLQAQKSMETRKGFAKNAIDELIAKICQDALTYLAGGNTVEVGNIRDNIDSALNSIASRQFNDFAKGDYKDWDKGLKKALDQIPDALKPIGWDKDPKDHPIATEILRFIGNDSKQGKEIRSSFMKAPYGWSQDAIDTMILMLRNTEHISTTEPSLNQAKISTATFKKESHTLQVSDKLKLRKLYQDAGISCKPGDEFIHSNTLLQKIKVLAAEVSGDAPRPEMENLKFVKDIENLDGNERLLSILSQQDDLKHKITDWSGKAALVAQREPQWMLLDALANFAPDEPGVEDLKKEIDAIRNNRLLLQEPDAIAPILTRLTDKVRIALNKSKESYLKEFGERMDELMHNEYYNKLEQPDKHRLLSTHQLLYKPEVKTLDAQGLLNQLRNVSIDAINTRKAALSGRFQAVENEATKLAEPKAQNYSMPKRTLKSQDDINTYIAELKKELEELLKKSSAVILN
jgi:hypothetical protein